MFWILNSHKSKKYPVYVFKEVLRKEACAVLQLYHEMGEPIYNPFTDTHHSHKEMPVSFESPAERTEHVEFVGLS